MKQTNQTSEEELLWGWLLISSSSWHRHHGHRFLNSNNHNQRCFPGPESHFIFYISYCQKCPKYFEGFLSAWQPGWLLTPYARKYNHDFQNYILYIRELGKNERCTSFQDQNIPICEMIVEWHCLKSNRKKSILAFSWNYSKSSVSLRDGEMSRNTMYFKMFLNIF